jgi:hypothetical protein
MVASRLNVSNVAQLLIQKQSQVLIEDEKVVWVDNSVVVVFLLEFLKFELS